MSNAPRYASFRDYLRVLRQQRVVIFLVTAAFVAAALVLAAREQPTYQAEAALQVRDPSEDANLVGNAVSPQTLPEERSAVTAELATRPEIADRVKRTLRLTASPTAISAAVTVQAEARTNLVVVQAKSQDKVFAAKLANAFATEIAATATGDQRARYRKAANDLRRQTPKFGKSPTDQGLKAIAGQSVARLQTAAAFAQPVTIARAADAPSNPVSPKPVRNGLLGLVLGLSIALLVAFIRDSLDRRLRTSREIQEQLKLPLLGLVRQDAMGRVGFLANGHDGSPDAELETYRILRTNLEFLDVDQPLNCVIVTSGLPEEGKSTVAASLAWAAASSGKTTLLVECDLRRPSLADRLQLDTGPGLSEFLSGTAEPAAVLQTVAIAEPQSTNGTAAAPSNLVCITAGRPALRPAEMLGSKRFHQFLAEVRSVYDFIVLDTAPLLAVSDTLSLLPQVDGIVVCVRAAKITREQAHAVRAALGHLPSKPTGIVVTDVPIGETEDYGYYAYAYSPREGR